MRILAGDIGGTKTALALYEAAEPTGPHRTLRSAVYASADHASLLHAITRFLGSDTTSLSAAAFGIAGPVRDGACITTNLPWSVTEGELTTLLRAPVRLINDFHATTLGVRALGPEALHVLQHGVYDASGPFAVIGAGTGLGEAIGIPIGDRTHVLAGEGGHADFAPRDALEMRLLSFLSARHGRVSIERVVSGLGLEALYELVVREGLAPADPITTGRFATESAGAVIGERGLSRGDPAAAQALALFVSLYGAEAGNLALRVLPTGGLYVAGGIAHKLLPLITSGTFMTSFLAKGRMSKILERVRVVVVLEPEVGLLGAKACAAVLSGSS